MKRCPTNQQIEALYDGELDPAQSAQIKVHLIDCSICQAVWNELTSMSRMFATTPLPEMLPLAKARLHQAIDRGIERGMIRFAEAIIAVAACIVIAGSIWMMRVKAEAPQVARDVPKEAPPWVAVATSTSPDPVIQQDATPAAQWYLADAGKQDDMP